MDKKQKFHKLCDRCLCELLNDPDIKISQDVFHCNICDFHFKYCDKVDEEKELYEKSGRNFFVDLVEYNIIKQKIRDVTMIYLMKYLNDYFRDLKI